MNFLEKDLEDIIYENPKACLDRGLYMMEHDALLRQLNLRAYGIADLVGINYHKDRTDSHVIIATIYELKKDIVDASAMMQACRYRVGLERYMREKFDFNFIYRSFSVLIGKDIQTSGDFVFTLSCDPNTTVYTYNYGVDGIRFKESNSGNWCYNNEKFVDKDFSKVVKQIIKSSNKNREILESHPF